MCPHTDLGRWEIVLVGILAAVEAGQEHDAGQAGKPAEEPP